MAPPISCVNRVYGARGSYARKEVGQMAKTEDGKKIVPVQPYTKVVNGKRV